MAYPSDPVHLRGQPYQQTELLEFTKEEIGALLAALNFTKRRTTGVSWLTIDEYLLRRLEAVQREFGIRYATQNLEQVLGTLRAKKADEERKRDDNKEEQEDRDGALEDLCHAWLPIGPVA